VVSLRSLPPSSAAVFANFSLWTLADALSCLGFVPPQVLPGCLDNFYRPVVFDYAAASTNSFAQI